jgi:carboxyl-terminal processing protease
MCLIKFIVVVGVFIIKRLLSLIIIIISIESFGDTKVLKTKDIHPIIDQMMIYHVENQKLDANLIRRSFKVLFDQFDPEKVYFIQSEVDPYLEISDSQVEKILKRVEKQDYKDYQNALKLIQSSIYRARAIRIKKLDEMQNKGFVVNPVNLTIDHSGYPTNKSHLTAKIEAVVNRWLEAEKKDVAFQTFNLEEKDKTMRICEKRIEKFENFYLSTDSKGKELPKSQVEHNFSTLVIKSFAKSLDAHTTFFSPEEALSMRTSLSKQFKGIGVVLRENGQGVYIADLIKGGPAYASHLIEKGDLVIAIDGVKTQDKNFEEILHLMQGIEGSGIKLTLSRKVQDASKTFDVVLLRQKIIMDDERLTYSWEPFANGIIGKVQFNSFYDNGEGITTEKDFKEALKQLREHGELLGLVIDLRQNPGGFLSQAVKVAGLFIPKGIVAIAKYSTGEIQYSRDLDGRLFFQGPVVIMTSKASASAAEVVAQALQDYGVAVIVGDERTYGKGSMQFQNITDEHAEAYFKVTVGRYYTVSGRSTQIDGVIADIVVPSYYAPFPIGERFLQFPITRDDLGFSFVDPNNPMRKLSGIDSEHLFSSYFPRQQLKWKNVLPVLRQNSQERIKKNYRYVEYLNKVEAYQEGKNVSLEPWKEDMQLTESMNIVKDMILLDDAKK